MSLYIPEKEYNFIDFYNIIISESRFINLKVLCFLTKYSEWDDQFNSLYKYLNKNGVKIRLLGEIRKLEMSYIDEYEQESTIIYYGYLRKEIGLLLLFTTARREEIENTIDKVIKKIQGMYFMPVTSSTFNLLSHYLQESYKNTDCIYFSAKHSIRSYLKGKNRPDIGRTIVYYGKDGFLSLNEMRELYGIIPKIMRFKIPDFGEYEVASKGKISFRSQVDPYNSKKMLFEVVNFIIDDVLKRRKIIEDSKFSLFTFKTKTRTYEIPQTIPWVVNFSEDLSDEYIDILKDELIKNNFTLFNETSIIGDSFSLSGMMYDEEKHNIFMIHIDNKKIVVTPYFENYLDTSLRLYELLSDFDPNAKLTGALNE